MIALNYFEVNYFDEHADGPVRRLAAAVSSAASRGGVLVGVREVSQEAARNHIVPDDDEALTLEVSVSSVGGVWTSRAYHFSGTAKVTVDAYSVTFVDVSDARALITNNEQTHGTSYTGEGVNYVLAKLVRQVVMRDLALQSLGLAEGPQAPQSLADWEGELGQKVEFTDVEEAPNAPIEAEPASEAPNAPTETEVTGEAAMPDWERELLGL